MKKFSLFAAVLALCLALLPGTAWAAEPSTGVTFANESNNVTLTDGKFYVAATDNKGITQQDDEPASGAYLSYNSGTLTVHGAFETTAVVTVNSNLTITGDENSSLSITSSSGPPIQLNSRTLTLSGGVNFAADSIGAPVIDSSSGKFETANTYSGDIVINSTGNAPAVNDATLNVQNSGSIAITGQINASGESVVLKSTGDVSIISGTSINASSLTVEGNDVSIENTVNGSPVYRGTSLNITATGNVTIQNREQNSSPTIVGTAEIAAGGNVTISGGGLPIVQGDKLTINGAQNVSITGKSSASNPFFYVPVTFTDCNNVTVTDNGDGDILKKDVTVTSDKPWTAKTGEKTVTLPSGSWTYGGDAPEDGLVIEPDNPVNAPTAYKAGEGWMFYEPPKDGSPAKLTLDNATYEKIIGIDVDASVSVVAKGENRVGGGILVINSVKVDESGGTLNAIVVAEDEEGKVDYAVYGKVELPGDISMGEDPGVGTTSLTIRPGAELTIPSDVTLEIKDLKYFENNGTLVNNGKVTLTETAATSASAETIKNLGLTGSGSVKVEKENPDPDGDPITDTYTNSGTKLLAPAGTDGEVDLSSAETTDANWDSQGYKWEVTKETDDGGNEVITGAKLTLAPGFNAEEVILPDAAVEIVTTGDSRIGSLKVDNPQKTKLTFSGAGQLIVEERINLAGGAGNTITVAAGAKVTANNGIYVGATGESSVTVNGILEATGFRDNLGNSPAVSAGKVAVGSTGVLEVSGGAGVLLNGMSGVFTNLFTVTGNGRFTANCSEYNVQVVPSGSFPGGTTAEGAINLGEEYMPDDCMVELKGNAIKLMRKDENGNYQECTGPLTIHKNHTWSSGWTPDGENGHYHACTFEGCTAKQPGSEAPHFYRSCVCTVCGYRGPEGTPDSPGGGSGGSGGNGGSGDVDCPSRAFSDLDTGKWYHEAVDYVLQNQLMGGYGNGRFGPDDPLSRAQFAQILYNREGQPPVQDLTRFADVPPQQWYAKAVCWAAARGLVAGYGDGRFGPEDRITREQLALMLWRYAGSPAADEKDLAFADAGKASGYAREALRWAVETGIVTGKDGGLLDPQGQATRAEAAAMLMRFFSLHK